MAKHWAILLTLGSFIVGFAIPFFGLTSTYETISNPPVNAYNIDGYENEYLAKAHCDRVAADYVSNKSSYSYDTGVGSRSVLLHTEVYLASGKLASCYVEYETVVMNSRASVTTTKRDKDLLIVAFDSLEYESINPEVVDILFMSNTLRAALIDAPSIHPHHEIQDGLKLSFSN